jgi:hypothetical protein
MYVQIIGPSSSSQRKTKTIGPSTSAPRVPVFKIILGKTKQKD